MFPGLESSLENENFLNTILDSMKDAGHDYYEFIEIPELEGIEVAMAADVEIERDILCYFHTSECVGNLNECNTKRAYEYWDGSNFKLIWLDENMSETEILVDDEKTINLDQWDGNNMSFRGKFNHGLLHPVIEIDGEKAEGLYLLEEWSQWEGDIPTGEIISEAEAEELQK